MGIWLDQPSSEPFNGILVVMNPTGLGDLSQTERDVVAEAVKKAIAGGWAIVRVYDRGVDPTPDWMDENEDQCFGRTPSWIGLPKSAPMNKDSKDVLLGNFPKTANNVKYVGVCEEGGTTKFFSPTKV